MRIFVDMIKAGIKGVKEIIRILEK